MAGLFPFLGGVDVAHLLLVESLDAVTPGLDLLELGGVTLVLLCAVALFASCLGCLGLLLLLCPVGFLFGLLLGLARFGLGLLFGPLSFGLGLARFGLGLLLGPLSFELGLLSFGLGFLRSLASFSLVLSRGLGFLGFLLGVRRGVLGLCLGVLGGRLRFVSRFVGPLRGGALRLVAPIRACGREGRGKNAEDQCQSDHQRWNDSHSLPPVGCARRSRPRTHSSSA